MSPELLKQIEARDAEEARFDVAMGTTPSMLELDRRDLLNYCRELEADRSNWKQWHQNMQVMRDKYSKQIDALIEDRDEWRRQVGVGIQSEESEGRKYIQHIALLEAALDSVMPCPALTLWPIPTHLAPLLEASRKRINGDKT